MSKLRAYYNENDRDMAHVLRCLIADGLIAPGDVDDRSIKEVRPDDLRGYTQCHFFAGGGLWSVAARMARWPDARPLWTGSCPCQPFSGAGKGLGTDDPRHLWPDLYRLIRACRPPVVMGEQVAGKAGYGWLDGIRADLAREGYASRGVDIPACAVDAPHQRNRIYWIAVGDAFGPRLEGQRGHGDGIRGSIAAGPVAEADGAGAAVALADGASAGRVPPALGGVRGEAQGQRTWDGEPERSHGVHCESLHADADGRGRGGRPQGQEWGAEWGTLAERDLPRRNGSFWADAEWIVCHDEKARRAKPGIRFLVDGLPGRIPAWRLAGNAISPVLAAEVIAAFMETTPLSHTLPKTRRRA